MRWWKFLALFACDAPDLVDQDNTPPDFDDPCVELKYFADRDADGFGDAADYLVSCTARDGWVKNGDDCDDRDGSVFPGALEACADTRDKDCDGVAASRALDALPWYPDADEDGFGSGEPTFACSSPGAGWSPLASDCDPDHADRYPGAPEIPCDLRDQDCDGIDAIGADERRSYATLDDLWAAAATYARVRLCPGTYEVGGVVARALDIEGDGAVVFVVPPGQRLFDLSLDLRMSGVQVLGGTSDQGGAIRAGGAVELTEVTFQGATATGPGGAVYAGRSVALTDVTFDGMTATGSGGAVYAESNIDVLRVRANGVSSGGDGGFLASGESIRGSDVVVTGATAAASGGALYAFSGIELDRVTGSDTEAALDGGFAFASKVDLSGDFSRTRAGRYGGLAAGSGVGFTGSAVEGEAGEAGGFLYGDDVRASGTLRDGVAPTGAALWVGQFRRSFRLNVSVLDSSGGPAVVIGPALLASPQVDLDGDLAGNLDGGIDLAAGTPVHIDGSGPTGNGPFDLRWPAGRVTLGTLAGPTTCVDAVCTLDEEE
jgi:predicted outer membrane repeat protein